MAYNSDKFDLSNWNITLPVDGTGGKTGLAVEVMELYKYESEFFYDAPDGAMVFRAMADGATTSGTHYARCELREMVNVDTRAAWKLSQGGTMTATLKVDSVPTLAGGGSGKVIVGQIHGKSDELVRLYWEGGKVFFRNDQSGSTNSEHTFTFKNAAGQEPSIGLGEKFSYMIDAYQDKLVVKIFADGQEYVSSTTINSVWQSDTFYFKAGAYLGTNETQGSGVGQVSFYGLDFSHTRGEGLDGLGNAEGGTPLPATPAPEGTENPDIIAGTHDINTIHGLGGDDVITGRNGADKLYGDAGNDRLSGDWHEDMLDGGAGNDTLDGGQGNDTLIGGAGDDIATGGTEHDTFVVNKGDGGMVITDFTLTGDSSDQMVFNGYSAAQLAAAAWVQSGSSAVLDFGDGTTVTFQGHQATQLDDVLDFGSIPSLPVDPVDPPADPVDPEVPADPVDPADPTDPVTPADPVDPAPPAHTVTGTDKNEVLRTPDENDTAIHGRGGNDRLMGDDGNDSLYGDDGNDTLMGYWGNDWLEGGLGKDALDGAQGDDHLFGGDGDDRLKGVMGNDWLDGGLGKDILDGGIGDDVLAGGGGIDRLTGGKGADTFVFTDISAADVLLDFDPLADLLDVSALMTDDAVVSLGAVGRKTGLFIDLDGSGPGQGHLLATFEGRSDEPADLAAVLITTQQG